MKLTQRLLDVLNHIVVDGASWAENAKKEEPVLAKVAKYESAYDEAVAQARAQEVMDMLTNIDLGNQEVKDGIAKEYFNLDAFKDFRNKREDEIEKEMATGLDAYGDPSVRALDAGYYTEEEDAAAYFGDDPIGKEKYEQYLQWKKTGEIPMYSSISGAGISDNMIDYKIYSSNLIVL